ncbi:hypothetical protein [Scytonema sp. UIC 10036]|nr:hypothetical protein [Scytonema sp. UIC 10036]
MTKTSFIWPTLRVVWGMCAQPHAVNRRSDITQPGKQAIGHHPTR